MASSFNDGYEYSFVKEPPDRVICKICHNPCQNAHLTGCCGAHFCFSCLQQLKKGVAVNKACPICREEKFKIFPNKQLDREIKELQVYCVNRKSGCTWLGEMNHMEKHIDADCQFVDIPCPSKCGVMLKRQCVQLHLAKECPCHCQYCGATGDKAKISKTHKEHCSHYPLPCPNGCELGVVAGVRMADHKKVCPLELVQCDYNDIGCKNLIARKELKDHYKGSVFEHLALIKSSLASIVESIDKTEKKLQKHLENTNKSMENTKKNYDKLKLEMKAVEDRMTVISARVGLTEEPAEGMETYKIYIKFFTMIYFTLYRHRKQIQFI